MTDAGWTRLCGGVSVKRIAAITLLATCASSCVYPSKATYFEIVSTDGLLGSSSCTYPGGRLDSILRSQGDVQLTLSTSANKQDQLEVILSVSSKREGIEITAKNIFLQIDGDQLGPESFNLRPPEFITNRREQYPFRNWADLMYSKKTRDLTEFMVVFGRSSIIVGGVEVSVKPVTLRKVSKTGLYLFTINC